MTPVSREGVAPAAAPDQPPVAVPAPAAAPERSPDHTVRLPGGQWLLWRQFVLRGAGFPVSLVDRLCADGAAVAADRHMDALRDVKRCREAAIDEVSRAFAATDAADRRTLWARRRRIFSGTAAIGVGGEQEDALARAIEAQRAASTAYLAAFDREAAAAAAEIARIAADPRFHEAGLWQNHSAVRRVRHSLGADRGNRHRRALEFVAMQIQRYAVKNDSIGFFGPIGWGHVSEEPVSVAVRPGPSLIDRREVFFEGWCIDALVDRFNEDRSLVPWTSPRLATGVWTDAAHVYAPARGVVPTTALQRRVLDLCDGCRTAADIATAVATTPESGASSDAQVFDVLHKLVGMGLLVWRLEVAPQLHPERELEARVALVGDPVLREACAGAVRELVDARDRVARAAGRAGELASALEALDATFVRLTGREPSRRPGEMYAGRGIVYEDCRRNCDVTLGRDFLARVGPPLSLVLDGARWASAELADAVRRHMRRTHAEMRAQAAAEAIEGHAFFERLMRTAPRTLPALLRDLRQRVQAAWQSLLQADYRASRVTRDVGEIAGRARDAFQVRTGLWTRAQYISPDIMIAARSLAALRRGEYHCVLGEVHTTNSLLWSSFGSQHPHPQWLVDALARDTGDRTAVFNQVPKDAWLARTALSLYAPGAWQYQFGDLPPRYTCRPAAAAMFVAVDTGETIVMRARDGSLEFDAVDLIGTFLGTKANEIIKHWRLDEAHVPRVTIGDLTIARERWTMTPAEMPFLADRDRSSQFAAARAWALERGMPRRVFYKSPAEEKPCYLDFNSPVYTALFVKQMKPLAGDASVRIEEMLPDVDDAWLVDVEGSRYTCELRLAALPAPGAAGEAW